MSIYITFWAKHVVISLFHVSCRRVYTRKLHATFIRAVLKPGMEWNGMEQTESSKVSTWHNIYIVCAAWYHSVSKPQAIMNKKTVRRVRDRCSSIVRPKYDFDYVKGIQE